MRGRATGVALSALVVLGLIAVVAVASTGSVSTGSSASRRPSDTLLDTLVTLWLLAVVAGGILVVYGLMQRKAIAKQMASGRYPRFTIVGFVVFTVVIVWILQTWRPVLQENAGEEEDVFVGGMTTPAVPGTETVETYEPDIAWLAIVVVVGLVIAAAAAYVLAERRRRRQVSPREELAQELAGALEDALDDLRAESDPRRAIIAAYARLERVLAAHGIARRPSETADEYLERVLAGLELPARSIGRLTELFAQAKFSHHEVDSTMKESAIDALEQVRDELRALREDPRSHDPAGARAVPS